MIDTLSKLIVIAIVSTSGIAEVLGAPIDGKYAAASS
jgi:RNA polymerase subunit RPABC4/transcription elongation factor Spt4